MQKIRHTIALFALALVFSGCPAPEKKVTAKPAPEVKPKAKKPAKAVAKKAAAKKAKLAASTIELSALFSDNMVLQRKAKVPIWGKAKPGAKITISLAGKRATAAADKNGKWTARLQTPAAGGPYTLTLSDGGKPIQLKNVLVGEVWLCSGQSNMQWTVRNCKNAAQEIADAKYPKIRHFTVPRRTALQPLERIGGKWTECSPETVARFSAVAYFFGRELHTKLQMPIGLINSSVGGTRAEAWTSIKGLKAEKEFAPILKRWEDWLANEYAKARKEYEVKKKAYIEGPLAKWKADKKEGKPTSARPPRGPHRPWDRMSVHHPSNLYNAMIAPLIPYAIRGVIWYQGESNVSRAYQYRKLFPAMIKDWRRNWGRGDFPFLLVQLANYHVRKDTPVESAWAELREAQLMTLSLPNTGMAVIIDIGEAKNIHPKNKQDVGKRLALWALAKCYGKKIVFSGPLYESMKKEGSKIRLRFKHTGSGLVAKGGALQAFAIAGKDRKFVWATAKIEKDTVVVWNDKIKEPVAVRYGWQDNPPCNLYNAEGLPASPFRTDDWAGVTAGKSVPSVH